MTKSEEAAARTLTSTEADAHVPSPWRTHAVRVVAPSFVPAVIVAVRVSEEVDSDATEESASDHTTCEPDRLGLRTAKTWEVSPAGITTEEVDSEIGSEASTETVTPAEAFTP